MRTINFNPKIESPLSSTESGDYGSDVRGVRPGAKYLTLLAVLRHRHLNGPSARIAGGIGALNMNRINSRGIRRIPAGGKAHCQISRDHDVTGSKRLAAGDRGDFAYRRSITIIRGADRHGYRD